MHIKPYSLVFVSDHFKRQKMCAETVCKNPYWLKLAPDHYKTYKMCNKAIHITMAAFILSLTASRPKKCAIQQLKNTRGSCTIFRITSKLKWCLMMYYVKTLTLCNMFPINL